jgi:hypothetical protein
VAAVCLAGAVVVFIAREGLAPRWFWDGTYWTLLGTAFLAVIRRRRGAPTGARGAPSSRVGEAREPLRATEHRAETGLE